VIGFAGESAAVTSTNAGVNWSALTVLGTGSIYGFNAVSGRVWYGRGNIVYSSTNNGTSFVAGYTGTVGATYQALSIKGFGTAIRGWAVSNTGLIAMYDETGIVLGSTPNTTSIPSTFTLNQNYPNPFNPVTKISFALPKAGFVTLKVYDLLGKEVSTLVNQEMNAGSYNVDFNGAKLSSGLYFYKLETNGFSSVKKMMLVK
jgi:hypothetical protein